MAALYQALQPKFIEFIKQQQVFFVATAPEQGRINLSPKGMNCFRVLDDKTVAYLDVTGSGNETSAHLLQNGRITIMFCSFSDTPLILRLYGIGRIIQPEHDQWASMIQHFEQLPGTRQIIHLNIESLQTSCGFGVPVFEFIEERQTLKEWAENKGEKSLTSYRQEKNIRSIDGLPTHFFVP